MLLDHPSRAPRTTPRSRSSSWSSGLDGNKPSERYGPSSASIATRKLGLGSLEQECPNCFCRPARSAARGEQRSAAIRHRRDAYLGGSFFTRKQIANVDQKPSSPSTSSSPAAASQRSRPRSRWAISPATAWRNSCGREGRGGVTGFVRSQQREVAAPAVGSWPLR